MKSFYQLSLLITLFALASCSSDPCEEVNCLNGGICMEGTCDCPPGWAGADCSIFDFEYIGRYSSESFIITNCNTSSNNGSFTANGDEEYCLVDSDGEEECLRITLILEADNMARFIQVETRVIGNIRFASPTVFSGTYSTNNEVIVFTADDNAGSLTFTVKEDRSALTWIQPSSGSDGCVVTHDFVRT